MLIYDRMFSHGSEYQELHNALQDHTIRSTEASRQATPPHDTPAAQRLTDVPLRLLVHGFDVPSSLALVRNPDAEVELTPHQEYILWNNWVTEISAWVSTLGHRGSN